MNELYGVDPLAPANALELGLLLKLFDVGEGRFIAEFPMHWIEDLKTHMSRLSDLGAVRADEAKARIQHALLPVNSRFRAGKPWAENATDLRREVVRLIGVADCSANAEPLRSILAWPDVLVDSRGGHIHKTARDYAVAVRPLFFTSPTICLVDPYFRLRYRQRDGWVPDRRRAEVLRAFLEKAAEARRVQCFRLTVSRRVGLEDDESGEEMLAIAKQIAEESGNSQIKFEVEAIEDIAPHHGHARYLLGTRSGLQFDYGFDTSTDGKLNHVHWMSRAELEPLLRLFMNAPTRIGRTKGMDIAQHGRSSH